MLITKKRITGAVTALFMSALLAVTLAGCGGESSETPTPSGQAQQSASAHPITLKEDNPAYEYVKDLMGVYLPETDSLIESFTITDGVLPAGDVYLMGWLKLKDNPTDYQMSFKYASTRYLDKGEERGRWNSDDVTVRIGLSVFSDVKSPDGDISFISVVPIHLSDGVLTLDGLFFKDPDEPMNTSEDDPRSIWRHPDDGQNGPINYYRQ